MFPHLKKFFSKIFTSKKETFIEKEKHPLEDFFEASIEEIMTNRSDIVYVYVSDPFERVVEIFLKNGFRSLPVCEETLDNVVGVLTAHSILSLRESPDIDSKNWAKHINHAEFVPSSMNIKEALHYFQKDYKSGVLFVVDEYGGIQGLVTSFNLIKGLNLTYFDDIAEEEDMIISKDPLIISGLMDIDMFEEEFHAKDLFTPDDEERVNTIGGFLCAYVGRVPIKGELISHPSGFVFEISQADPRKIHQITLRKVPEQANE